MPGLWFLLLFHCRTATEEFSLNSLSDQTVLCIRSPQSGIIQALFTKIHNFRNTMPSLSLVCHFFSSQLLDLFSEIHKWDKLKYEIPQCASDIYQHRQELEGLREETLLLIKNYNRCDTLTCTHLHITSCLCIVFHSSPPGTWWGSLTHFTTAPSEIVKMLYI